MSPWGTAIRSIILGRFVVVDDMLRFVHKKTGGVVGIASKIGDVTDRALTPVAEEDDPVIKAIREEASEQKEN